ncbi:MAG: ABC transporter permease [Enterocloster sp.]
MIPVPIILTVIIFGISAYLFYKTKFGRYTVSIGSNEEAPKLVGINVDKIKILVFVLSGVFCAIAGIILASRSEAAIPTAGNAYEMDAIAATVIGGTSMSGGKGNMFGTALGAILMATIKNGLSLLNVNTFASGSYRSVHPVCSSFRRICGKEGKLKKIKKAIR